MTGLGCLKVVLISPGSGSRGGGEHYLQLLSGGLIDAGHRVDVVVPSHPRMDEFVAGLAHGVTTHRLDYPNTYFDRPTRSLGAWLDRRTRRRLVAVVDSLQPDVVHLSKQTLEDAAEPLLARFDAPKVVTVHITRDAGQLGQRWAPVRDWVARRTLRASGAAFVTVSEACGRQLREFASVENVTAVANGIAADVGAIKSGSARRPPHPQPHFFDEVVRQSLAVTRGSASGRGGASVGHGVAMGGPGHSQSLVSRLTGGSGATHSRTTSEARATAGNEVETFRLVASARMEEQKDPLFLIEQVMPRVEDGVHLTWLGDGSLAPATAAAVDRLGLGNRVTLAGWCGDVRQQLPSFDAFVLPSRYEGFPFSILEAMAAGLPCLVNDVDGNGEAVEDGVTGRVIAAGDADGWIAAIERLAVDRETSRSWGAAGRRRFVAEFTVEAMTRRTVAVYRAAIEARRGR